MIFSAVQGGLLLTQSMQSIEPLVAALDGAIAALHAAGGSSSSGRKLDRAASGIRQGRRTGTG
jgi:hypothetical protein